jgi:predicted acetyltransferase
MKLSLVVPSVEYKESFLKALKDLQSEEIWWYENFNAEKIDNNFEEFIHEINERPGQTTFWGIVDNQFAGSISVRHELTPELRIFGGNIGYDTAPDFRKRGVATEMLRKVIPFAKSLGLIEVLLTCDDNNIGSIKVIDKNGGILKETKKLTEGKPLKRYYWIPLN